MTDVFARAVYVSAARWANVWRSWDPTARGKGTLFKVVAGVMAPRQRQVTTSPVRAHRPRVHWLRPTAQSGGLEFPRQRGGCGDDGTFRHDGPFHWPRRRDWEFVNHALETVEIRDLSNASDQRTLRRTAAANVHRPRPGAGSRTDADGRAADRS